MQFIKFHQRFGWQKYELSLQPIFSSIWYVNWSILKNFEIRENYLVFGWQLVLKIVLTTKQKFFFGSLVCFFNGQLLFVAMFASCYLLLPHFPSFSALKPLDIYLKRRKRKSFISALLLLKNKSWVNLLPCKSNCHAHYLSRWQ